MIFFFTKTRIPVYIYTYLEYGYFTNRTKYFANNFILVFWKIRSNARARNHFIFISIEERKGGKKEEDKKKGEEKRQPDKSSIDNDFKIIRLVTLRIK